MKEERRQGVNGGYHRESEEWEGTERRGKGGVDVETKENQQIKIRLEKRLE